MALWLIYLYYKKRDRVREEKEEQSSKLKRYIQSRCFTNQNQKNKHDILGG